MPRRLTVVEILVFAGVALACERTPPHATTSRASGAIAQGDRSAMLESALPKSSVSAVTRIGASSAQRLPRRHSEVINAPLASFRSISMQSHPPASAVTAEASRPVRWPPAVTAAARGPWCGSTFVALSESACVAFSAKPSRTLLIYFHGIVPPAQRSPQLDNLQKVVFSASQRAGVVALLPRGVKGLAPRHNPGWWGWPTTDASYRSRASALVEAVERQQAELESLIGARFERRYLAGSSSGAYFVTLLAFHGDLLADGLAVLSGGSAVGRTWRELDELEPRPVYVGFGRRDPVSNNARALAGLFERAGWRVRIASHPVGHGAREIYLDEAFAFWFEAAAVR